MLCSALSAFRGTGIALTDKAKPTTPSGTSGSSRSTSALRLKWVKLEFDRTYVQSLLYGPRRPDRFRQQVHLRPHQPAHRPTSCNCAGPPPHSASRSSEMGWKSAEARISNPKLKLLWELHHTAPRKSRRIYQAIATCAELSPSTPIPLNLGVASRPPSRLGSAFFLASALVLRAAKRPRTAARRPLPTRVPYGKIAIDRPLQQSTSLCPGREENRQGIAPHARFPRDAV